MDFFDVPFLLFLLCVRHVLGFICLIIWILNRLGIDFYWQMTPIKMIIIKETTKKNKNQRLYADRSLIHDCHLCFWEFIFVVLRSKSFIFFYYWCWLIINLNFCFSFYFYHFKFKSDTSHFTPFSLLIILIIGGSIAVNLWWSISFMYNFDAIS